MPEETTANQGFGDPAALGLAGFALTTMLLSLANANILHESGEVLGLALFYGGIAQLIAGLWEFANKNTFGATAFVSYGAFWLSFWYLVTKTPAGAGGNAVGAFLFAWGIFSLYMLLASFRTNLVVFLVFLVLVPTFLFLGLGAIGGGHATMTHIGGWLGIVTALLAWYGSAATVVNKTWGKTVLPVKPLNA